MHQAHLLDLLERVRQNEISPADAVSSIASASYRELAHGLCLDIERERRTGLPEVVLGKGKSVAQIETAVRGLLQADTPVLVTKLTQDMQRVVMHSFPDARSDPQSGLLWVGVDIDLRPHPTPPAELLILSAGASDLPVAMEVLGTARFFGLTADIASDVGAAGLHRLLSAAKRLHAARLLVVVAGMDGVLPTLVAGMTNKPVIAVPTSVGYGACFHGLAPLLTMLNACSPGVAVMNIDNGFGAAAFARRCLAGS